MKRDKKPPLNFRFHNPNSEKTTIDLILSVFLEVNKKKAMEAIDKALGESKENKTDIDDT